MSDPIQTPRTYAAAGFSFDRLMQESEQMETELAQAQAECDRLAEKVSTIKRAAMNAVGECETWPDVLFNGPKIRAERDSLRAELAEARKDSERLDWLDGQSTSHRREDGGDFVAESWSVETTDERNCNIRAAIDAAKGAE